MLTNLQKSKFAWFIVVYYLFLLLWWLKLSILGEWIGSENYLFGTVYPILSLIGGINGLLISRIYGGWSSVIGKGIIFLSLGLLGQTFGQFIWTYYNVIAKIEVPYPSLADFGYFALIPAYTLAAWMFAQAAGAKFSLRTSGGKIIALFIPLIAIVIADILFLKNIGIDLSTPIKTFLDFGYPLGEIIPVSIALFTLTLSRNLLGGSMRNKILYLIGAFFFQFLTEYAFLYTAGDGTYINGGWNDLMYATSYTIMSLGIITFRKYD
ncbi:MAG: hypothetical protein Q7R97_00790 [Candidatus Daviesbacteria bacterium]|nr:hypothetical protein [Candidatus Daviesbacteria bacterium]